MLRKSGTLGSTECTAVSVRLFLCYFQSYQVAWRHSKVEVTQFLSALQSTHSCFQQYKIYQEYFPQLQSKIKWNIFHILRCNEENFHDVRFLSYDIRPLSKQIIYDCVVFIPLSNGTKIIKIAQEMQELQSRIKWHHFFTDTVYKCFSFHHVLAMYNGQTAVSSKTFHRFMHKLRYMNAVVNLRTLTTTDCKQVMVCDAMTMICIRNCFTTNKHCRHDDDDVTLH